MAKGKQVTSSRNDARPSGKSSKQHPGRRGHGSRSESLSEMQKVLMGKGLFVRYARVNADGVRQMAHKRNRKTED